MLLQGDLNGAGVRQGGAEATLLTRASNSKQQQQANGLRLQILKCWYFIASFFKSYDILSYPIIKSYDILPYHNFYPPPQIQSSRNRPMASGFNFNFEFYHILYKSYIILQHLITSYHNFHPLAQIQSSRNRPMASGKLTHCTASHFKTFLAYLS